MVERKRYGPGGGEQPPRADVPAEDERPPVCPRCHKRLVILATHWGRDANGKIRRQLWGCPQGHATIYRTNGAFGSFDILPDAIG